MSFFLIGAALLWVIQLHLSWMLMLPFILHAFFSLIKPWNKKILLYGMYFVLGYLTTGLLLIPTFATFGISSGEGNISSNIIFNINNFKELFTVLLRYLSLATFELTRFMGESTTERLSFLREFYLFAPFIVYAGILGALQVVWMIVAWFRKNIHPEWKTLRMVVLLGFTITWLSFFFPVKGPSSHTFYLMLPLVMIYSFYCLEPLFKKKWIVIISIIFLFSGIVFHSTLSYKRYSNNSMYMNYQKPLKAIQSKDYKVLGERRNYDRN